MKIPPYPLGRDGISLVDADGKGHLLPEKLKLTPSSPRCMDGYMYIYLPGCVLGVVGEPHVGAYVVQCVYCEPHIVYPITAKYTINGSDSLDSFYNQSIYSYLKRVRHSSTYPPVIGFTQVSSD